MTLLLGCLGAVWIFGLLKLFCFNVDTFWSDYKKVCYVCTPFWSLFEVASPPLGTFERMYFFWLFQLFVETNGCATLIANPVQ